MLADFFSALTAISWIFLAVLLIKVTLFLSFSIQHYTRGKKKVFSKKQNLSASIIIPSYNEELTLRHCVEGLLKQTYTNYEIIIVDDGSTDWTAAVGIELAHKYPKVRFFTKENGGNASALNFGILQSPADIIVSLDADSIFLPETLEKLMVHFDDDEVAAVGGNVKVANRNKLINKHQAMEYISGLHLQRRSFAHLNCMQVISGAIGAFRKNRLQEVGGYSTDTIVEDMDITVSLARRGNKIAFAPDAIAYTEAPENIRDFIKQRYRWNFGGFQVLSKHRDILFNKKFGTMGTLGLPYFLIFPWVDVLTSLLFFASILRGIFYGGILNFLIIYLCMAVVQAGLLVYALHLDKEKYRMALISMTDSLWYSHLISFVILKAALGYLMKKQIGWDKFARLGKNIIPEKEFAE